MPALSLLRGLFTRTVELPPDSPATARPGGRVPLPLRAMMMMSSWNGKGEQGRNNAGPDVEDLLLAPEGANWCAHAVCRAYEVAAAQMNEARPLWLPTGYDRGRARVVWNAAEAAGERVPMAKVTAGCLALFKRKGGHHIGIVSHVKNGVLFTWDGNVGHPGRAVIDLFPRDVRECLGAPRYPMFAMPPG